MKSLSRPNIQLLSVFSVLLLGTIIINIFFTNSHAHPNIDQMNEARNLCQSWMDVIDNKKYELDIRSDVISSVPNKALIGNDWSEITTTLGTLEAKELTTNPDFAALMVKLISDAGMDKERRAGVMLSGSFPALAIATFAALQTLEMEAVIVASLGASSFGANQPQATWLDYEAWLADASTFSYNTSLVTRGAENDNGAGLMEEGVKYLDLAALRNRKTVFVPSDLQEAMMVRTDFFKKANIDILINIGGGQAAVGSCVHNLSIPIGLNRTYTSCLDEDRGVICRMSEQGIPFIHLLNVKDLAVQNGIPIAPGKIYSASVGLYNERGSNKIAVTILLIFGLIGLVFLRKSRTSVNR